MRQMLLRVPDDLHARMARTAKERGTSINGLAQQILDRAVPAEPMDERARLREKARQRGVLVETPPATRPAENAWQRALASTQGIGPVLDQIFADGR